MTFDNTPPKWDAEGAEPSTELQEKGFVAGYKPPAAYFNYLFNRIVACIKELQSKLKTTAEITDKLDTNAIYSIGTAIPSNSTLDDYINNGVFYSSGSAVSATITNAPFITCGFRLMVVPTIAGDGYKKQIALPSGRDTIAVRSYFNNKWTDWLYIEDVGELSNLKTTNKNNIVAAINELVENAYNLSGGTKLTEGADLNDYTQIGNYYCHQNKIAETLINCPTNSAFKMKVGLAAGSLYPSQEITIYNTYVKYYRWFNTDTNAWSDFRVFAETGNLSDLTTTHKGNLVAAINEIDECAKWLNNNSLKSIGTELPENADLDTYTECGVFRSPNASRSGTLNNAPYTGSGFRFIVFPTISPSGGNYIKQLAIPSATNTYSVRTLLTDGWTDWHIVGDVVDNLLSTRADLPLSANQGRILKEGQDELNSNLDNIVIRKRQTVTADTAGSFRFPFNGIVGNYVPVMCDVVSPTTKGQRWVKIAKNPESGIWYGICDTLPSQTIEMYVTYLKYVNV